MKMKFYKCSVCGKIIAIVNDTNIPTFCCGMPMGEMIPKTEEGKLEEKHVPLFIRDQNKVIVFVGEKAHPMDANHHIEWIAIRTNKGNQRKIIENEKEAKAIFYVDNDEKIISIYAYCNLHGLWKRDYCSCANTDTGCNCMEK